MELLMNLLGAAIAVYIVVLGINYFPPARAFFKQDAGTSGLFSKDSWRPIVTDRKWRNKALFTLLVILAYKSSFCIPIPGISQEAIGRWMTWISLQTRGGTLPGILNASQYMLAKYGLFRLGVAPFVSACVLLQFFSFIIPPLRRLFYGGQSGFLKIQKYTLFLTYFLAVIMSFALAKELESFPLNGIKLVLNPGWSFRLVAMASWVAGFSLILWLANLISRYGLGNGWAVLFCADIIIHILTTIFWAIQALNNRNQASFSPFATLVYVFLLGIFIMFLTGAFKWHRLIPARIGVVEIKLPLNLSRLASYPMSLAVSIVLFPATLSYFWLNEGFRDVASALSRGHLLYYILLGLFTIFLSRFYMLGVVARPVEMARQFRKYAVDVAGLSDENQIMDFLRSTLKNIALLTGLLLTLFACLPDLISAFLTMPYLLSSLFNGVYFLIIFGILTDTASQLRARVEMEKSGCQSTCYIAGEDLEAQIKQCFLQSKGIPCVTEPYGFTWGLPARTAASYYKLNVEPGRVREAQELLGSHDK